MFGFKLVAEMERVDSSFARRGAYSCMVVAVKSPAIPSRAAIGFPARERLGWRTADTPDMGPTLNALAAASALRTRKSVGLDMLLRGTRKAKAPSCQSGVQGRLGRV